VHRYRSNLRNSFSHISIPGYYLLKSNHPDGTAHGGAAILINTNLKFHPITNFSQNHIQFCAISITLNNIPIVIAAVYSPPKHLITGTNLTEYFGTFPNNFIAGGDFNTKNQSWGCRVINLPGKLLQNFTNIKKNSKYLHHLILHTGQYRARKVLLFWTYLSPKFRVIYTVL